MNLTSRLFKVHLQNIQEYSRLICRQATRRPDKILGHIFAHILLRLLVLLLLCGKLLSVLYKIASVFETRIQKCFRYTFFCSTKNLSITKCWADMMGKRFHKTHIQLFKNQGKRVDARVSDFSVDTNLERKDASISQPDFSINMENLVDVTPDKMVSHFKL